MAYQLFVTSEDLKKHSALSGNLDKDKVVQFIRIAMDIHVKDYLGTDLFDRIQAGITASDLTVNETALLADHIKPMTIHWSLVGVIGFAPYTVADEGVYKHTAESSETVSKSEVDSLIERHRNIAQSYTRMFITYMCNNPTLFPEYTSNSNGDIKPNKDATFSSWEL